MYEQKIASRWTVERIKRLLLATIGVMIVGMGCYIWVYRAERRTVKPEQHEQVPDADVSAQDVEVKYLSHDRVLWHLFAKEALVNNATKETRLASIAVDFFDELGMKSLHVVSDRGTKDDQQGNLVATGNVQATAIAKAITLKSEELQYTVQTGLVTSSQHVEIQRNNLVAEGDEFESDLNMRNIRILRNVRTTLTVPEKPEAPVIIVADTLHLDNVAQIATYTGNVRVTQAALQFSAAEMRVAISQGQGSQDMIDRVDVFGNVQVQRENLLATGETGEYLPQQELVQLRGTPDKQAYGEDTAQKRSIQADLLKVWLATGDIEGEGRVKTRGGMLSLPSPTGQ